MTDENSDGLLDPTCQHLVLQYNRCSAGMPQSQHTRINIYIHHRCGFQQSSKTIIIIVRIRFFVINKTITRDTTVYRDEFFLVCTRRNGMDY